MGEQSGMMASTVADNVTGHAPIVSYFEQEMPLLAARAPMMANTYSYRLIAFLRQEFQSPYGRHIAERKLDRLAYCRICKLETNDRNSMHRDRRPGTAAPSRRSPGRVVRVRGTRSRRQ